MNDPVVLEHYRYLAEENKCTPEQIFKKSPWILFHSQIEQPNDPRGEVLNSLPQENSAWIELGSVRVECVSNIRVTDAIGLVENPAALSLDLSITYPRFLAKKFTSKNVIRTGTLLKKVHGSQGGSREVPKDPIKACFERLRLEKSGRSKQLLVQQSDGLSLENYVASQLFSGRVDDVISALLLIIVPYSGKTVGSRHSEFVGEASFLSYSGNSFIRVMRDGRDIGKLSACASNTLTVLLALNLVEISFCLVDLPGALDLGCSFPLEISIRLSPLALTQKTFTSRLIGEAQSIIRNAFYSLFTRVLRLKPMEESVLWNLNFESNPATTNERDIDEDDIEGEDGDDDDDELKRRNNEIFGTGVENFTSLPVLELSEKIFSSRLRKYQLTALEWMVNRECGVLESTSHPMWDLYSVNNSKIYMNHISGEISLEPPGPYSDCRGGILADEMGLGKTVEILALVAYKLEEAREFRKSSPLGGGTLIILPLSLVAQWNSEIEKHFAPRAKLRVLNYSGDRHKNIAHLTCQDIVLTTYGTTLSEFSKGNSPLYSIKWDRIILDEAHYIKSRSTRTSKSMFALAANQRWCLTGTPIQNTLDDVFSLFHFLQVEPWGHWAWWNRLKISSEPYGSLVSRVQKLTEPLLLRRTIQTIDCLTGKPIISLPPKFVYSVWLEFVRRRRSNVNKFRQRQTERDFYNAIYNRVTSQFEELVASGPISQNYTSMLQLLLRLRQACCHPLLVYSGSANQGNVAAAALIKVSSDTAIENAAKQFARSLAASCGRADIETENFIKNQIKRFVQTTPACSFAHSKDDSTSEEPCPICLDTMENPVISHCGHVMCQECVQRMLKLSTKFATLPLNIKGSVTAPKPKMKQAPCPVCRSQITPATIAPLTKQNDSGSWFQLLKRLSVSENGKFAFSAKLEFLDQVLSQIVPTGHKVVIFSQWVKFLDLIEELINHRKIPYCRLDGSQTAEKRREQIMRFTTGPKPGKMTDLSSILGIDSSGGENPPPISRITIDLWTPLQTNLDFKVHSNSMVLLASLKAGGVGLNLTAATYLFLMDSWWNPAVEEQAMQRVHRIGQNWPVHIFRLYVKDSVETRILELQNIKGEKARGVLEGGGGVSRAWSVEDIRRIFTN